MLRCRPYHRPKLEDHRWYNLKALLNWADNLGRWQGRLLGPNFGLLDI
ncbi:22019_t:CDS:2, partial [Rhizophagus irregularis]